MERHARTTPQSNAFAILKAKVEFSALNALHLAAQQISEQVNQRFDFGPMRGFDESEISPEDIAEKLYREIGLLFTVYAPHKEQRGTGPLGDFLNEVRSGVRQGFEETNILLESLGILAVTGVTEALDRTRELIQQRLADFERCKSAETEAARPNAAPCQAGHS